ncbi:MAG: alpha/beta fold hydrolase [Candidatus Aureabacteria bacterium]|nr:alpha/beta fold hydrolase [Candidatus Auribacterota bacterium]
MNTDESMPEIRELQCSDGAKLRFREWLPKSPKATIVGLHGLRSHSAWYLESCGLLCRKGYRVIFPDRRGSGLNAGRGGGEPRCGRWLDDVGEFARYGKANLPGRPVHLLGISWGGRLAVAAAAAAGESIATVVLSSPGLVPLTDYSPALKLRVLAALLMKSGREFSLPLDDPALFTDDPDEQGYIEEDGLGLRTVTARFLYESRRLERLARARVASVNVPVLLLLSGRDEIVNNAATAKLISSCATGDTQVKTYPAARHTLEFDRCRGEYFEDLVRWFDAHTLATAVTTGGTA